LARSPRINRYKNKQGGGRYAALAFLTVIGLAVVGYLLFAPKKGSQPPPQATAPVTSAPTIQPLPPLPPPVPPAHSTLPTDQKKPESGYPADIPVIEEKKPRTTPVSGTGQLAIIIDDMGTSLHEARTLAGIGVPLTFSIIPGLRSYREVAAFAASKDIEIMIHIPMQSKGWPGQRLESNGLLVSMTDSEISGHLEEYLRTLPRAAGANNHMGSEFSEHEDKMRVVLESLQGKGLFFVDSVTSPKSVGVRLARELGMKSGRRNVFLDNEQNGSYIRGQLSQAVRLAKKNGAAIAICHPHPATIQALAAVLPGLAKQGVALVPVSRVVR
jgi:polysaccharide deacetylase 2 family uncharacterized protein YibQ